LTVTVCPQIQMRKHFSAHIEKLVECRDDIVFVTGDLGFNALEPLQQKLGDKFINAGVAEQNMVSMAAGIASQGFHVLCYSIAPFAVYRCLEQIRNDVCFHNLPVYIVGNGGGYGYGIMGSSHHAIEDIACLSGLPNMHCYIPAFIEDMHSCIDEMFERKQPSYLRLGLGKNMPSDLTAREFGCSSSNEAAKLTVIVQGPIANNLFAALKNNKHQDQVQVFILNKTPQVSLPSEIETSVRSTQNVLTIEEHIAIGGLGTTISYLINENSLPIKKFVGLHAKGYPTGLYGSQSYHQEVSGLDEKNISTVISSYF
jgi:transketolase